MIAPTIPPHLGPLLAFCLALPAFADIGWNQDNKHFKPASAHEGPLTGFLKPSAFETQPLFPKGRFPNLAVAMDGSVLAAFGNVEIRRSEDGGNTWSPAAPIAKGFSISGLTVDEISGDGKVPPWVNGSDAP